ncbi:sigma-70 family RNA polymerase sigma factor [Agrobacterium sp. Ap1]|jgi:RNA polymerase sigma-70 factor (ECF subfamily)|uniref:sigma-70 family RNA polymerase sigma factor n=1 Tax=Rhizobium/Agrobacterium group TaxID=227290 RepID=UPI000FB1E182|nr:sigma-70 family RNA polymerase sigma factor [Agrobacterium sp. Ap1]MBO0143316.1 sigma-70 family RNA polymerase sigma factor [Agrobacterium sp. Ap1]
MNQFDSIGFTEAQLLEHTQALRNFARRFHPSSSDIDDLVQETMVKAIANADKFQRGTQLRSWLFTIMRNTFCTKFGIVKREQVGNVEDAALRVSTPANQEWTVRGHELEVAIAGLSKDHRMAIELIFIECLSYEDAAGRCGCALGTIKSRVNRARLHLSAMINQ